MNAGCYMFARNYVSGELCNTLKKLDQEEEKAQKEEERKVCNLTTSQKVSSVSYWGFKGFTESTLWGGLAYYGASLFFGPSIPLGVGILSYAASHANYLCRVDPNQLHFKSERKDRLRQKIWVIQEQLEKNRPGIIGIIFGRYPYEHSEDKQLKAARDGFQRQFAYLKSI